MNAVCQWKCPKVLNVEVKNQFKIWETITCPSAELICIATQGWSSTFSYFEVRVGTAWVDKCHFVFYHL